MKSEIRFVFPIDGDVMNSRDGEWKRGALVIPVGVKAAEAVSINGVAAAYDKERDCFVAQVPLTGWRNSLLAKAGDAEARITVFRMEWEREKTYRISSDDNVRFLQELNEGDYASVFEHPYLAVYKEAHDRFGAKVNLNLFYSFDDEARVKFSEPHSYFDLSMMTERYREEFIANASWLKLSFHAKGEFPDKPYRYADGETVRRDCLEVCRQILRFAGKESLSNETTVHWGEANREGVRALRALGIKNLAGYFERTPKGEPLVSYYLEDGLLDHVGGRDFWVDTAGDMIFARIDRVLNLDSAEEGMAAVRQAVEDPHRGGFVSLMIHEQYFYSDYENYLPDFAERVLAPCEYLFSLGYRGAFLEEVTEEKSLREHSML